jgi:hypothetical protein
MWLVGAASGSSPARPEQVHGTRHVEGACNQSQAGPYRRNTFLYSAASILVFLGFVCFLITAESIPRRSAVWARTSACGVLPLLLHPEVMSRLPGSCRCSLMPSASRPSAVKRKLVAGRQAVHHLYGLRPKPAGELVFPGWAISSACQNMPYLLSRCFASNTGTGEADTVTIHTAANSISTRDVVFHLIVTSVASTKYKKQRQRHEQMSESIVFNFLFIPFSLTAPIAIGVPPNLNCTSIFFLYLALMSV